jgi:hypothetical protein
MLLSGTLYGHDGKSIAEVDLTVDTSPPGLAGRILVTSPAVNFMTLVKTSSGKPFDLRSGAHHARVHFRGNGTFVAANIIRWPEA